MADPWIAMATSELDKTTVVSTHLNAYRRFESMSAMPHFKPSIIPSNYSPSVSLHELLPISLSQLLLDTTHHGRVLFGTLCVDAFIVTAVMTVLQDLNHAHHAVAVSIYNVAPSSSSFAAVQKMFPKGTKVAIKNPYLKRSLAGIVVVRVDNPANLEKLDDRPPLGRSVSPSAEDPEELRRKGNRLFAEKDWKGAIDCYSRCIDIAQVKSNGSASSRNAKEQKSESASENDHSTALLAYSNRAEAWMKLENYQRALEDAESALAMDADHAKSLFRKGRALHGLMQYAEACTCFESLLGTNPELKEVQAFLSDSRRSLHFQKSLPGLSDFLLGKAPSTPKYADFVGPVVVDMTKDARGRGLFATSDVKRGEVLLVSNAMAHCEQDLRRVGIHIDANDNTINTQSQEDLVTKLVSLGMESPKFLRQLYSLASSSSQNDMAVPSMDLFKSGANTSEDLQVDIMRIRKIVRLNSFGNNLFQCFSNDIQSTSLDASDSSGLWLLPSFMNHSCTPNASRMFVGDAIIVHAASEIPAGSEITTSYFNALLPLKMREEACQPWGFCCSCKRCVLERSLHDRLEGISSQFQSIYGEASKEFSSAMCTPKCSTPGTYYPACMELSKIFKRLRKKMDTCNLTSLEKKWVLAGYSPAFLGKWFLSCGMQESTCLDGSAIELMEAMRSCVPGSPCTLSFAALLWRAAQLGSAKGLDADYLMEQAREECVCLYGKQKRHVVDELVEQFLERAPIIFSFH